MEKYSVLYNIPKKNLIEPADGFERLLAHRGQTFLSYWNELLHKNNLFGYYIAPSIYVNNMVISYTTCEYMLLTTKWYHIGEIINDNKMTVDVAYYAAAWFINRS